MKLHVLLAICSQNKTVAASLAVLVASVIGGGFYASTSDGQSAIRQLVSPEAQTAVEGITADKELALAPSTEKVTVTIDNQTVTSVQYIPERFKIIYNMYPSIFMKPNVTIVFTTDTTAATAATDATDAPAVDTTNMTTQPAVDTTAQTTQLKAQTTTTSPTTTAVPAETTSPTTTAKATKPAATTAAPAATTAAPAATTAAPAAPAATAPAPAATVAPAAIETSGSYDSGMARAILDLVNEQRAVAGLPALTWNDTLAESANIRATEIVVKWSHTRPDGSAWYTAGSQMEMGENLAYGQSSTTQVMDEWMASSGHAENILRSSFTQIGVSCYYYDGTYYWAQHFA